MIEDDLEPLITKCPNCATRFRVTENQLAVAAGRVRCGACLTVFEGTDHLLLDEETAFSTESEADAALDELLDELSDPEPERSSVVQVDFENSSTRGGERSYDAADEFGGPPQIYGGFEEEAEPGLSTESDESEEREGWSGFESGASEGEIDIDAEVQPAEQSSVEEVGAEGSGGDAAYEEVDLDGIDLDGIELDRIDVDETDVEEAIGEVGTGDAPSTELPFPDVSEPEEVRDPSDGSTAAEEPAPAEAVDQLDPVLTGEVPVSSPISFAPEPRRWWVGVVAAVFVLVLVVQVFYFQFPSWSRDPDLRPVYGLVCNLLGCELPGMRDLRRMSTRNLVVRSHPDLTSALIVDAVIVNDADFEQPFPDLELRFTAVGGLLVAGRRFTPAEYLSGSDVDADAMPSDTPVQVSLEIEDPGPDAVNYTLKFR